MQKLRNNETAVPLTIILCKYKVNLFSLYKSIAVKDNKKQIIFVIFNTHVHSFTISMSSQFWIENK